MKAHFKFLVACSVIVKTPSKVLVRRTFSRVQHNNKKGMISMSFEVFIAISTTR